MRIPKLNFNVNSILSNSHLNTIIPVYLTQNIEPNYTRERLDTPDGDFIDLDWVNKDVIDKPTLVLFHGTEGSSKSHYARRIMFYLEQIGWRGVVPHYRSCSDEINRKPRFYHAGDIYDLSWVLSQIKARTPKKLFASGVSLGGNMLLKFLGENPDNPVNAAIAISVPFDLEACTRELDNNLINKHLYVKHFLNSLLPKMQAYAEIFKDAFLHLDRKIETLSDFNDTYICKTFNFKDEYEYYEKCSCIKSLKNIVTPTLILQAQNDPMIPVHSWPDKEELSPSIRFVGTKTGGHAGFITLSMDHKKSLLKLPKFMVEYFNQQINSDNFEAKIKDFDDAPEFA